jgi:hypothetical protein
MKYMCIAYEEERKLNELSQGEWQALRQETLDYVETLRKSGRLILTYPFRVRPVRRRYASRTAPGSHRRPVCRDQGANRRLLPVEAGGFEEAIQIAAAGHRPGSGASRSVRSRTGWRIAATGRPRVLTATPSPFTLLWLPPSGGRTQAAAAPVSMRTRSCNN